MKKTSIVFALFASALFSHAQTHFDANLDGLQEVPPNASPAFGQADLTLSGTTLSLDAGASYQDLLGNSTVITLRDAPVGSTGATIFTFTLDSPGATTGTISGSGTLTAPQITDLDAGSLYLNIQSTVFPSGEIRGQIEVVPEPSTLALLGAGAVAGLALRRKARRSLDPQAELGT